MISRPKLIEMLKKIDKSIKDLNFRIDGRVEWVCNHGVGHTVMVPEEYEKSDAWWSHGCDGCCRELHDE